MIPFYTTHTNSNAPNYVDYERSKYWTTHIVQTASRDMCINLNWSSVDLGGWNNAMIPQVPIEINCYNRSYVIPTGAPLDASQYAFSCGALCAWWMPATLDHQGSPVSNTSMFAHTPCRTIYDRCGCQVKNIYAYCAYDTNTLRFIEDYYSQANFIGNGESLACCCRKPGLTGIDNISSSAIICSCSFSNDDYLLGRGVVSYTRWHHFADGCMWGARTTWTPTPCTINCHVMSIHVNTSNLTYEDYIDCAVCAASRTSGTNLCSRVSCYTFNRCAACGPVASVIGNIGIRKWGAQANCFAVLGSYKDQWSTCSSPCFCAAMFGSLSSSPTCWCTQQGTNNVFAFGTMGLTHECITHSYHIPNICWPTIGVNPMGIWYDIRKNQNGIIYFKNAIIHETADMACLCIAGNGGRYNGPVMTFNEATCQMTANIIYPTGSATCCVAVSDAVHTCRNTWVMATATSGANGQYQPTCVYLSEWTNDFSTNLGTMLVTACHTYDSNFAKNMANIKVDYDPYDDSVILAHSHEGGGSSTMLCANLSPSTIVSKLPSDMSVLCGKLLAAGTSINPATPCCLCYCTVTMTSTGTGGNVLSLTADRIMVSHIGPAPINTLQHTPCTFSIANCGNCYPQCLWASGGTQMSTWACCYGGCFCQGICTPGSTCFCTPDMATTPLLYCRFVRAHEANCYTGSLYGNITCTSRTGTTFLAARNIVEHCLEI